CENCQTVLANEQVENGRCERCKNPVIQKELEQWFFKITAYAEELLGGLKEVDWPEPIKQMQTHWIGKSTGGEIDFPVVNEKGKKTGDVIRVFTTRPDTLFGATYLVLAPEHKLVNKITAPLRLEAIKEYQEQARGKSELERTDLAKNKTGVPLGVMALNPANGEKIQIWMADYVLATYGTGAIMAVPAHDERDYEFAMKYQLPVRDVIKSEVKDSEVYTGDGVMINSGEFNGLSNEEARAKILKKVGGASTIRYRIRDWLVSRQRYWGAPIPIIYCAKCGTVTVPEKDLPVHLPDDVDFRPTGESPLQRSEKFHNVKCPTCGGSARRESDTMDTFVCSSWYFLRYTDPANTKEAFSKKNAKYWMPVDLYVGGAEHAAGHLIFSRFITKFLRDQKYLNFDEPFKRLVNQGLILAEDGRKMSKSLGNVVNPDVVVAEYGADTLRMYEMFMGPLPDAKPWNTQSIKGTRRFLDKVNDWLGSAKLTDAKLGDSESSAIHKLIKKITGDMEKLSLNTAISAFMIFLNDQEKSQGVPRELAETFLKLLHPFAPHLTEELWERIGGKPFLSQQAWPKFDPALVKDTEVTLVIQINGKLRGKITVSPDISEKEALALAKSQPRLASLLVGKTIKQSVFVPGKLVNFVVE
ncbi:leucine--tRNA ligase, partial [Candidatus Uhrbacteria bacterium]|nr:leucine--tRNA ligase [Candidatus Uhrbacteria bacterium]